VAEPLVGAVGRCRRVDGVIDEPDRRIAHHEVRTPGVSATEAVAIADATVGVGDHGVRKLAVERVAGIALPQYEVIGLDIRQRSPDPGAVMSFVLMVEPW